ncbi:Uncharacterised protein [Chlamydia trachomatis]|nr:Uncharacterised protein [Chlamydia trachomatis]
MSFVQKYPYITTLISLVCFAISFWFAIGNMAYCFNGANILGIAGTIIAVVFEIRSVSIIDERLLEQ